MYMYLFSRHATLRIPIPNEGLIPVVLDVEYLIDKIDSFL